MKKLVNLEKETLIDLKWLKFNSPHMSQNAIICEAIRRMARVEKEKKDVLR